MRHSWTIQSMRFSSYILTPALQDCGLATFNYITQKEKWIEIIRLVSCAQTSLYRSQTAPRYYIFYNVESIDTLNKRAR